MLTITESRSATRAARGAGYCDGLSRRGFLKIGALGLGAGGVGLHSLTLADVLRADEMQPDESRPGKRHKSVINVFLGGGPPHQDMWDIKTDAPAEIRGEFQPISTNVPGIQIGETFPQIAAMADKCVFIRSIVGTVDRHEPFQCYTGWTPNELASLGGRPSIGSAVSKLQGPVDLSVPPFVGLANVGVWKDPGKPGFLGPAHAPFTPDGPGMANMKLNGLSLDQLGDRRKLLAQFDQMKRWADSSQKIGAVDAFSQQAFNVLTSSKLVEALDLSREDPKIVARYGDGKPYKYQYDGAPTVNDHLLIARRLVEAGVRCVTLTYGRWDSHGRNFDLVRDHGGKLDQCLSALIEDLDQRGMLEDTTVIAWGEFGRTPRINKEAGRDHWPRVSCALLAGGGMKTGQVIGSTNRLGEHAQERPVHVQEVLATLYHNLGIDTQATTLVDPSGRPQYLVTRPAIAEVV